MIKRSYCFESVSIFPVLVSTVFCRRRYYVFNLSCDLISTPHCWVMRIYGWEFLKVCKQTDKSCVHKHYDSEDIMLLICYVTSSEHMFKGYINIWVEAIPKRTWLKDQVTLWVGALHGMSQTLPNNIFSLSINQARLRN